MELLSQLKTRPMQCSQSDMTDNPEEKKCLLQNKISTDESLKIKYEIYEANLIS